MNRKPETSTTRTRRTTPSTASPARPRARAKAQAAEPLAPAPTHEQIALRAHELYVGSGCQQGREQEFWLEAERQLLEELKSVTV